MSTDSEKPRVIEYLFDLRWEPSTGTVSTPIVSMDDVVRAIRDTGANLSTRNPANFLKDIVRKDNRNTVFPDSVVKRGYTAEQFVGEGNAFRFITLPLGQTTAFEVFEPTKDEFEQAHPIESISLPIAARRLGRKDESWLTQVSVRLHLLHTHLALHSSRSVIALDLLQTNVKLRKGEVDAAFLAHETVDGEITDLLVACEVKRAGEVLEKEQIERGAMALRSSGRQALGDESIEVIPMGVKTFANGSIWVVEFHVDFPPLTVASSHVYVFQPSVKGI